MASKYIHKYKHISKEWKILFCRVGRLNHCQYLNLFCTDTIWLFTAFAQINSNVLQIICIDTLLGNGISPSIFDRKIKWIEAFQNRLMATSIGFSSLVGIIYSVVYNIVSFFWLYFCSSIQHGDNYILLARWWIGRRFLCCILFSKVHLRFNFKGQEYYKHHMKTESITWSVTDSHSFDEMLDYGICNMTYRLDKTDYYLS